MGPRGRLGIAAAAILLLTVSTVPGTNDGATVRSALDGRSTALEPLPQITATATAGEVDAPVREAPDVWSLVDPAAPTVVINKRRPIEPLRYAPSDLVTLSGIPGGSGQSMRREAAAALQRMSDAANADGLTFSIATAYRSYGHQSGIYWESRREKGQWRTDLRVARPGYSEHQTGFAVDVYHGENCRKKACFGRQDIGVWIEENAYRFGYVIRYPDGHDHVTGYRWEPWHLRYVGTEVAQELHDSEHDTLEEFFGLDPAPSYG